MKTLTFSGLLMKIMPLLYALAVRIYQDQQERK